MARGSMRIALVLHLVWCVVVHGQEGGGPFAHVKQFGAQGDGATDDTEAVQTAIDAVGKDGGTLLFPPGTYVVTSVGLHPGVRYLGYGATIKRPAQQGKWVRTFNAAKKGYMYSGDVDSRALVIEGMTFDGNLAEQDSTYAVYCEADRAERSNRLLVDGGRIPSGFDYGIYVAQGGNVALRHVEVRAATPLHLGSSAKWAIDALIDNVRIEGTERYAVIPTHGPDHRFTHHNVLIDESVNRIETSYGIARNQYLGSRTILGEDPPTGTTHGLLGDVYRLKKPTRGRAYEWLCTRTACGTGAVWTPLTRLGAEGEPGG